MDFNRFTEKLQEGVRAAQSEAIRRGQQQVDVEHLLLALIEQEGGLAPSILLKAGVNLEAVHTRLKQDLDKFPRVSEVAPRTRFMSRRVCNSFSRKPKTKPSGSKTSTSRSST